ncbi:hypothetical protein JCM17478_03920 [Thermopirellula anaerolimosa]
MGKIAVAVRRVMEGFPAHSGVGKDVVDFSRDNADSVWLCRPTYGGNAAGEHEDA